MFKNCISIYFLREMNQENLFILGHVTVVFYTCLGEIKPGGKLMFVTLFVGVL